eukprot:SAG11_NODE_1284_length_5305_cov_1.528621_7_plen_193_part_00
MAASLNLCRSPHSPCSPDVSSGIFPLVADRPHQLRAKIVASLFRRVSVPSRDVPLHPTARTAAHPKHLAAPRLWQSPLLRQWCAAVPSAPRRAYRAPWFQLRLAAPGCTGWPRSRRWLATLHGDSAAQGRVGRACMHACVRGRRAVRACVRVAGRPRSSVCTCMPKAAGVAQASERLALRCAASWLLNPIAV